MNFNRLLMYRSADVFFKLSTESGSLVIPGIHNSMISGQIRNVRISPAGFFETNA